MSFNVSKTKSKIISFSSVRDTPNYILNGSVLDHVDYKILGCYTAIKLQVQQPYIK